MRTVRRVVALLALACGCAAKPPASPPVAPPLLEEPALALPADLDLVLRLDLRRLRAALGVEAESLLERLGQAAPADEPDAETARVLLSLFTRADTLWIGVRPGLSPELTDGVVALRGDFRGVVPTTIGGAPRWSSGRDIGGGVVRFERDAPRLRGAPAVIYLRLPDVVVVGSVAEIDALERGIEQRAPDVPLRAPERGLIAAAARLRGLRQKLSQRAPMLAGYLDGAERLEASFDREGDVFRLRVDVAFEAASQATSLVKELRALQDRLRGEGHAWIDKFSFEPLEQNVAISLALRQDELLMLVRCFSRQGC
ncbi:MAG: hypothetical protein ACOY0T_10275 [Myxococcota bacterium]